MGLIRNLVKTGIEAAAGDPKPAAAAATPTQQPYSAASAPAKTPLAGNAAGYQQPTNWSSTDPETGGTATAAPMPTYEVPSGKLGKGKLAFNMLSDPGARHAHSLGAVTTWAVTLLIIGIVFLILVITGTYPTSVDNQKAAGIYAEYLAKYSVYIVAAILGIMGASMGRRALRSASSTTVAVVLLVIALLLAVASIGLTIYLMVKSTAWATWWQYIIDVIIILERLLFIGASVSAVRALKEACNDKEAAATMVDSPVLLWSASSSKRSGR